MGRPLRIAVDEASWRYKSVSASAIEHIRKGRFDSLVSMTRVLLMCEIRVWKPSKSRREGDTASGIPIPCTRHTDDICI